jgi:hypothetical protein
MKLRSKWWAPFCLLVLLIAGFTWFAYATFYNKSTMLLAVNKDGLMKKTDCTPGKEPQCVMKTIFGLDQSRMASFPAEVDELPAEAIASINKGLEWILDAQQEDGGWGAGSHNFQEVMDPHQVKADPATTALVSLALLRTGNTLTTGKYSVPLQKGTRFLLKAVEQWPASQPRLTTLSGTQPQVKLGENIDAILTVQFFTTLLKTDSLHEWNNRIRACLDKCVTRIQKEQAEDGSWKGGGWAPVLQSALADNALESASDLGAQVDTAVLNRSKKYQKSNFDTATKSAATGYAAGVVLYSVSSTARSSAKQANKAKQVFVNGKKDGKVKADANMSEAELQHAGMSPAEAKEYFTAYAINEGTYKQATSQDVMSGFGSNGGEEFLSYLMTGESVILQGGDAWKQWFDMMLKKLISIQNTNGSWQGHHCITSPVFCTATCLLILSIQNDPGYKAGF